MSELQKIQEQIQNRLPNATYRLMDNPPPQYRELSVVFEDNVLIITMEHEQIYGVSVIDASEDLFEHLFSRDPQIEFDAYEEWLEYIDNVIIEWIRRYQP